jgi:hypothetical protein
MRTPQPEESAEIDTSLVECLVVAVPEMSALSTVMDTLAELVDASAIRVLDLVVVTRRRRDHGLRVLEAEDIDPLPPQVLVGRPHGGMLSENDIAVAASGLLSGTVGLVVLVEDRWAGPLSSAAKRADGMVLGGERIPRARIEAALVARPAERGITSAPPASLWPVP